VTPPLRVLPNSRPTPRPGTCATCRCWQQTLYNDALGACALTAWDDHGGHAHSSSRAKVQVTGQARGDSRGGDAVLETAASFGCVQWERA